MLDYQREDPTNSNSFLMGEPPAATHRQWSSLCLHNFQTLQNLPLVWADANQLPGNQKIVDSVAFTQEFVESFWQVWPTLKWWVYDGIWVKVAWNLSLEISIVEYLIFIRSTHLIMHMQCAAADLLQVLFRFLHFQAQLLCLRTAENPQRCWGKVRTEDHLDPFGKLLMTVGKQITQ